MTRLARARSIALGVMVLTGASASAQPGPRKPAEVTVALSGLSSFKGTLKGNCSFDQREHMMTVDAKGDTVFLRFAVYQTAAGPLKIVMEGMLPPKNAPWVRFNDLMIGPDHYAALGGAGTSTDAGGRAGSFQATSFLKAGAEFKAQNLKADVSWKCQ